MNWFPEVEIMVLALEELMLYHGKQIYLPKIKAQNGISGIVFISAEVLARIKYLRNSEEIVVVWGYSEYTVEKDNVCSASESIC